MTPVCVGNRSWCCWRRLWLYGGVSAARPGSTKVFASVWRVGAVPGLPVHCLVSSVVGGVEVRPSSQVKCLIPISQRAAKAVRAKTLSVLVVFCGAAPLFFRLPDGLIYVLFHSHSQFGFCGHSFEVNLCFKKSNRRFIPPFTPPRFMSAGAVV